MLSGNVRGSSVVHVAGKGFYVHTEIGAALPMEGERLPGGPAGNKPFPTQAGRSLLPSESDGEGTKAEQTLGHAASAASST